MYRILTTLMVSFVFKGIIASSGFEVQINQPSSDVYELNFELGEIDLTQVDIGGTTYSKILFEGSVTSRLKGYAELPYIHASLQLPDEKNVSLGIVEEEYEDFELSHPLLPSRGVIYRDQDPASVPYWINPASMRDDWYPQDLATQTSPFILRDVRGTTVYVYPFRYNAVQQILRVYKKVTVQLKENETLPINPLANKPDAVLREMDPVYRSLFINYGMKDDLTIGNFGDILVICTERDEEAIAPFIEWKREKGFNVSLEVVETGTNVKTTIEDAYEDNSNLLYVQLVGDWEDIKSDMLSGYAPMDPQLGCVSGTDDHPDICIGRFSANSAEDVTIQVDKVINYEKFPDDGADWYSAALGIASNQGPGDDGELDYEQIDVIYDDKLDPFTYDSFTTVYDPTGTSQMVTNALNDGVGIINYCGHGSTTSWGTTGFSNYHISGLGNGNMLPLIFSVACVNGEFNSSGDCFAEAWLKKEDGGAVMTMMSTINQPWNPPMRGQDYFNDLLTGGYDYDDHPDQSGINTSEGRTTIGAIAFNGLVLMCTESGGTDDWETAKTWHLFGDPSMQPRTVAPAALSMTNDEAMVGVPFSTIVSSEGEPLEGAMVCLSQESYNISSLTDGDGFVTLTHSLVPGPAKLVVTAFNMETIYEEITVIPPEGAYVLVNGFEVDDSNANGNGQADYGEALLLNVWAENVGTGNASSVTGTLTTSDAYVTITDGTHNFSDISAGEVAEGLGAFEIVIAADAPDGHNALMEVEFSAEGGVSSVSSLNLQLHAPVMVLGEYSIDDGSGNGNGSIDPGETVNILVEIVNEGSTGAIDVFATLTSSNPYISVVEGEQAFGNIETGSSGMQAFSIVASMATPAGTSAEFNLQLEESIQSPVNIAFSEVVGHIPVLIVDLDGNGNSADKMLEAVDAIGIVSEFAESLPGDLGLYSSVFLCLGIYSSNHVLTQDEGQALANYLDNGGKLYMEGGDTWYWDTQTPVQSMFGLNASSDGNGDLGTVNGTAGSFTEGMSFGYSGDNSYIDHIQATGEAYNILANQSPPYGTGVAYDAGDYRTIAASHEFGGLQDGPSPSTKEELMEAYLEFFGIDNVLTVLFFSDVTEICENESVTFTDLSSGGVISWEWEFEGGDPAYSSLQNPQVFYSVPGNYDVTLTVSDGVDSQSITANDYIQVNTCTGLAEENFPKISLFPNPNNGIFTLDIQNVLSNFVTIKVLNTLSNVVYIEENVSVNGDFNKTIDLSNLDKGMYFLVTENYQGSTFNRIIIR